MSTIAATNLKNASSGSNNIVLNTDGTTTIAAPSNIIKSGTAVASTSGVAIDFTGIPSWAKRVTVMLSGVSLTDFASEANSILVQLGDSGGVENSSYTQSSSYVGATSGIYSRTDGFHVGAWAAAGNTVQGVVQIANHNGNLWCASGVLYHSGGYVVSVAGSKTLSATLDRLRITTVNGTDTFDAGSINILWEG